MSSLDNLDGRPESMRDTHNFTLTAEMQWLAIANHRFSQTQDAQWLNAVLAAVDRIVGHTDYATLVPEVRARVLGSGERAYHNRFLLAGQGNDLIQAVNLVQMILEEVEPDPDRRASGMRHEGIQLSNRYYETHALPYLDAAVMAFDRALHMAPSTSPDRHQLLDSLAISLLDRYDLTHNLDDLRRAISIYEEVLYHPLTAEHYFRYAGNLGVYLQDLYTQTKDFKVLERSIVVFQHLVDRTPADSPDLVRRLMSLNNSLGKLYDQTGELRVLEHSLQVLGQVADLAPPGSVFLAKILFTLGSSWSKKYIRTKDLADLAERVEVWERATEAVPVDCDVSDYDPAVTYSYFGQALEEQYFRRGMISDLEQAIAAYERAVSLSSAEVDHKSYYLNKLGLALEERFQRTRALVDSHRAIEVLEQAVSCAPSSDPELPKFLSDLSESFRKRYSVTRLRADIDQAVQHSERAVELAEPSSPHLPDALWHLAAALADGLRQDDIDQAVDVAERAVRLASSDQRSACLTTLMAILARRLTFGGDTHHPSAVMHHIWATLQDAVASIPEERTDASYFTEWGNRLLSWYELGGSSDPRAIIGLRQAIRMFQKAVDKTPKASLFLVDRLFRLGFTKLGWYGHTRDIADLHATISTFERAWLLLQATFATVPVVHKLGQQRSAVRLYESLVAAQLQYTDVLAKRCLIRHGRITTSTRGMVWQAQRYAENAAKIRDRQATVMFGFPAEPVRRQHARRGGTTPSTRHRMVQKARRRALEVAEGYKSRMLAELIGRGHLPAPPALAPALVVRERELVAELTAIDTAELATQGSHALEQTGAATTARLEQRTHLRQELEQVWLAMQQGDAASDPAVASYIALRRGDTLDWQDFMNLAADLGATTALLSLVITDTQTILFVLRAGWTGPRILTADLPRRGWDEVMQQFTQALQVAQDDSPWDEPLRSLLQQALPYLDGVTHVVLAPAGRGHVLPWTVILERAGWRTPDGHVPALVMLPALGILPRLRRRPPAPAGPTLIAGNPTGDLPFALDEARTVATVLGTDPLLNTQATVDDVLSQLPSAEMIHLATHAAFVPDAPLDSGIVLADGTLTAREVMRQRLQANLLVLSGCETGQVTALGGEELAGLTQAFLYAGARALVVSLWQVNDVSTALLMAEFYRRYLQDQQELAEALRDAQRWLRDVTAHELAARFKAERNKPDDERLLPYERVSELWQHFQFDVEPDEQPFKHPFYWAAFVYTGV